MSQAPIDFKMNGVQTARADLGWSVRMPSNLYNALCAEAEKRWPSEAVGIVAEKADTREVASFVPLANRSPNPRETFFLDPFEFWKAQRALAGKRMRVFAIFHSHPTRAAVPSAADLAFGTEFPLMLIAERQGEPGWVVRAWLYNPASEQAKELPIESYEVAA